MFSFEIGQYEAELYGGQSKDVGLCWFYITVLDKFNFSLSDQINLNREYGFTNEAL